MRMLYLGEDDWPWLEHGRHYEIEVKEFKTKNRKRVTLVDSGFRIVVTDEEFKQIFVDDKRKKKRKRK